MTMTGPVSDETGERTRFLNAMLLRTNDNPEPPGSGVGR